MKNFLSIVEKNLNNFNEIFYVIDLKQQSIQWIGDIGSIVEDSKLKSPASLEKFCTLFNEADGEKFLQTPSLKFKKILRNLKPNKQDFSIKDEAIFCKDKKESYVIGILKILEQNIDENILPEFEQFSPLFYLKIKKAFENKQKTSLVIRVNITNLILISHLYSKA